MPMRYLLDGGEWAAFLFGAILYSQQILAFILGIVVLPLFVYFGGWKQLKDGNPWIGGGVIIFGFLACAWILMSSM